MATHEVAPAVPGRWGTRLSSRPLPTDDPAIEALSRAQRDALAAHWLHRASFERRVGEAFVVIAGDLRALGVGEALTALGERAIDDERRHTELSRLAASVYAGVALELPAPLPLVVPEHRGASPRTRSILHVLGHCLLNETYASAVLEDAMSAAGSPFPKAVLRELLSDELDHARLGWALLASLSPDERLALRPSLLAMNRATVALWRSIDRPWSDDPVLIAHGALSPARLDAALTVAQRDLLAPGLRHLGLPWP